MVYDDLSDAPNSTCDENEFSDSSDILELSDIIRHRKNQSNKYNISSKSEDSEVEPNEPIIEEWTNEDTFPNLEPFEGICGTNRYYLQNVHKYKAIHKQGKWMNVSCSEIKNLFGIFTLMGQIRKDNIKESRSVDPYLATPIFSKLMSRNRFDQVTRLFTFQR